jgi:hypothetical protein
MSINSKWLVQTRKFLSSVTHLLCVNYTPFRLCFSLQVILKTTTGCHSPGAVVVIVLLILPKTGNLNESSPHLDAKLVTGMQDNSIHVPTHA